MKKVNTPKIFLPTVGHTQGCPEWLFKKPGIFKLAMRLAITLDEVRFQDRRGLWWTVPRGMPTDGMSYPFVVEWMWDRFDPNNLRSGVLHDYAYALHDYFYDWPATRKETDQNFLDGLRLDDGEWERSKYGAVRVCGGWTWRHKDRNKLFMQWLVAVEAGDIALEAWVEEVKYLAG